MKSILLCCDSQIGYSDNFHEVWSLGTLTQRRLLSRGIISQNLLDVVLPDLDKRLSRSIEAGLSLEATRGGLTSWAEIAFQHIHWRFVRYYQYRLRLEYLIEDRKVNHLTVSSRTDIDLVHACEAACATKNVSLNFQNRQCDPLSSLLSFIAIFDLPKSLSWLDLVIAQLFALYYRAKKIKVFYQSYNNLHRSYAEAAVFTWRRSICFFGTIFNKIKQLSSQPSHNFNMKICLDKELLFQAKAWSAFDNYDVKVLNSAFNYFLEHYDTHSIDRIYASSCVFLRNSRVKRLVLHSDITCSAKLLSKAAREQGLQVDYLPHGVIIDDLLAKTKTNCGVDQVLAWNLASADAIKKRNCLASAVAHPCNIVSVLPKRPLPRDLSEMRVLILPPEWVGLSFASRPDCFERDILDVTEALGSLGVKSVHIKLHNATKMVFDAKILMLSALKTLVPVDFMLIDKKVNMQKLFEQYDLAIIGPTTGLLEASRSSTPFIGFRALMEKMSIFDGFQFPKAESSIELIKVIQNYDTDRVDQECNRMASSLSEGRSPFVFDPITRM